MWECFSFIYEREGDSKYFLVEKYLLMRECFVVREYILMREMFCTFLLNACRVKFTLA